MVLRLRSRLSSSSSLLLELEVVCLVVGLWTRGVVGLLTRGAVEVDERDLDCLNRLRVSVCFLTLEDPLREGGVLSRLLDEDCVRL